MRVNFNSLAGFLLISLALMVSGCSETPTAPPVDLGYHPPVANSDDNYQTFSHKHKKTALANKHTVWERLLSLYALPEVDNARVERELNWYKNHPDYVARVQKRAEPYLHLILDEIEAKHLPGELALLPVVESAYIPDAYSTADASGLWQFIPDTGRYYGLKQNDWYDGRRDIYASTKAATSFLKHLGETFNGDWFLALASYNWGKGNVWKAIAKNEESGLPTDFWSLDMPRETRDYVPRLIAIAKLIANAEDYHVPLNPIPNKPYLEVVDIKSPLDLLKAAQLANMPLDKFLKLNPGFNRLCTAPEGPHRLLVPITQAAAFKTNLAQLPFEERVSFAQYMDAEEKPEPEEKPAQELASDEVPEKEPQVATTKTDYSVNKTETFAAVLNKKHTTLAMLSDDKQVTKLSHPEKSNTALAVASHQKPGKSFDFVAKRFKNKSEPLVASKPVKKHEILAQVAGKTSVTDKNKSKTNYKPASAVLADVSKKPASKAGKQQLSSKSSLTHLIHYTVGKGDTLTQISKKYNVSLAELRKSNPASGNKELRPGSKIRVLVNSAT